MPARSRSKTPTKRAASKSRKVKEVAPPAKSPSAPSSTKKAETKVASPKPTPKAASPSPAHKRLPSPEPAATKQSPAKSATKLPPSRLIEKKQEIASAEGGEIIAASGLAGALGYLAHKITNIKFLPESTLTSLKTLPEAAAAITVYRDAKAKGTFGGMTSNTLLAGYFILSTAAAVAGSFDNAEGNASFASALNFTRTTANTMLFGSTMLDEAVTPTFWPAALGGAAVMYGLERYNGHTNTFCCVNRIMSFISLAIYVGRLCKSFTTGKDTKKVVPAAFAALVMSAWFASNILPVVFKYSPVATMLGIDASLAENVTTTVFHYLAVWALVRSA